MVGRAGAEPKHSGSPVAKRRVAWVGAATSGGKVTNFVAPVPRLFTCDATRPGRGPSRPPSELENVAAFEHTRRERPRLGVDLELDHLSVGGDVFLHKLPVT